MTNLGSIMAHVCWACFSKVVMPCPLLLTSYMYRGTPILQQRPAACEAIEYLMEKMVLFSPIMDSMVFCLSSAM